MYESFFEFSDRPFSAVPEARRYFASASIEEARATLARVIERGDGPGLVVGPTGTGKSLLCHVLAAKFRSSFDVVMLASARLCTRRALLQNILFELNLPYRDREEGELRLALIEHLKPGPRCPNGMLLLVDEAHTLPFRLLEEIRMITNLVRDGQNRVGLVLAGGSRLEERFAHPKLDSFNQRLAARCYLQPMSRAETVEYVKFQIQAVGREATRIFTGDAWDAIYRASDGVPRLVNQICDHALMLAAAAQRRLLDGSDIETAWADLQRLPTPWTAPAMGTDPNGQSDRGDEDGVVEFGTLAGSDSPCEAVSERHIEAESAESGPLDEPAEHGAANRTATPIDGEMPVSLRLEDHIEGNALETLPGNWNHPASAAGPHNPFEEDVDPFGDAFDEEEVIVDHYATLDAAAVPSTTPAAQSPAAQSLAAQSLAAQALAAQAPVTQAPVTQAPETQAHVTQAHVTQAPAVGKERGGQPDRRDGGHELVVFDAAEAVADTAFHVVEIAQPVFGQAGDIPAVRSAASASRPSAAGNDLAPNHPAQQPVPVQPIAAAEPQTPTLSVAAHRPEVKGPEVKGPDVKGADLEEDGRMPVGDDRDLIYVDSAPQAEAEPHPVPPPKAERREYRQLFARLRRV